MNDWNELMERSAGRVSVGPAPLEGLYAGASRRRRRRRSVVAGMASVIVLASGGAAVLGSAGSAGPAGMVDEAGRQEISAPEALPDGMRWAGLGSVAVAVPEEWGSNKAHCGTPQRDTVVVWQGAIQTCLAARPAGVESVQLAEAELFGFEPDTVVEVDGTEAEKQSTTCDTRAHIAGKDGVLCSAALHFPGQGVWVRVESSTDAVAVDALLEQVRVLDDLVGVPDHSAITVDEQGRSGEAYSALLRERGFDVRVETEKRWGFTPGYVLGVSPSPGTVVEPGSTVTVTVVAEPDGPADELSIGLGADSDPNGEITEEAIRSGDLTVRLQVGEGVWAYAHGKRSRTIAGEVRGAGLVVSDWDEGPNHPHSWVATEPGRSTVVLTIEVDGELVEVGRFKVVVE